MTTLQLPAVADRPGYYVTTDWQRYTVRVATDAYRLELEEQGLVPVTLGMDSLWVDAATAACLEVEATDDNRYILAFRGMVAPDGPEVVEQDDLAKLRRVVEAATACFDYLYEFTSSDIAELYDALESAGHGPGRRYTVEDMIAEDR